MFSVVTALRKYTGAHPFDLRTAPPTPDFCGEHARSVKIITSKSFDIDESSASFFRAMNCLELRTGFIDHKEKEWFGRRLALTHHSKALILVRETTD